MEVVTKYFFSSTKTEKRDKINIDKQTFSLKRIKLLSCESFNNDYIETILFTFDLCEEKITDIQFNVEIKMSTWYLPEDLVAKNLRKLLSRFKIVNINELINAFAYRKYYNEI